ncbi:hypothetical protein THICB3320757 [Thiomonas sp. CB3]|nr:hypothetical protein THICB3320757 [Thiomonas sp. CB3]
MEFFDHIIRSGTIIDAIQTIGLFVIGVYGWGIRKAMNNLRQLQKLDGEVDGVDKRVTALEHTIRHAPTHTDLAAIYGRINLMAERQSEMNGSLAGIQRGLDRVEEHLLNRKD